MLTHHHEGDTEPRLVSRLFRWSDFALRFVKPCRISYVYFGEGGGEHGFFGKTLSIASYFRCEFFSFSTPLQWHPTPDTHSNISANAAHISTYIRLFLICHLLSFFVRLLRIGVYARKWGCFFLALHFLCMCSSATYSAYSSFILACTLLSLSLFSTIPPHSMLINIIIIYIYIYTYV